MGNGNANGSKHELLWDNRWGSVSGSRSSEQVDGNPFHVSNENMYLKNPASCPSKPRGSPRILQRRGYLCSSSEHILLLLAWPGDPEEAFSRICFPGDPEVHKQTRTEWEVRATCPFPNGCSCLLGEGNHREGLQELDLGLHYGQLKKNGTSGKEISAKQGKLLFFPPSTSRRTFNSV